MAPNQQDSVDLHPVATVFVVEDDPSVRKSLGRLLRSVGYRVSLYESAEDFLNQPLEQEPACAILDVDLPGLTGMEVQQVLSERASTLPVVFLTGTGDIPMSVQAMKSGAVDFLSKPCQEKSLLGAVRQALASHVHRCREHLERKEIRQCAASLSPREREVMDLVVTGLLNKQVGHRLGVTEKTVKAHRAQVMHKMHAASLPDLVRMADRLNS